MTIGFKPCGVCGSTVPDEPNELDALRAEVERLRGERDAAVEWLQQQATVPGVSPDEKRILYWASQRIRKREHLKENK